MLHNYFVTASKNLLGSKLYSAINIVGLAVGLTAFVLISLYVSDELSYDKQWDGSDRIYRVNMIANVPGRPQLAGTVLQSHQYLVVDSALRGSRNSSSVVGLGHCCQ